jgi:hypothetical protein
MGQERCSAAQAFALLRRFSVETNRPMRALASDLITAVTGRPPTPPTPFVERRGDSRER